MSNLLKFIKDYNIEIHEINSIVWICVPFFLIEEFVKSCSNENNEYKIGEEEVFEDVVLTSNCLSVDINSIIEALDEDINDYINIAN